MTRPTRPAVPPEDEPGPQQPGFGQQPDEPRPTFTPRAGSPGPGTAGQQPSGPQVLGQYEPGLYQADPCEPDPPRGPHPSPDPYAQRLYPPTGQQHASYPQAPVPGPPPPPMSPPRPDAGRPAPGQTRPTFTPRERGNPAGPDGPSGPRHGGRRHDDGRPRPSFTPRAGFTPPPPDSRRRAANYPPPSAFLPPPGFPQPTQVIDMPRDGAPPGTVPPPAPDSDTSPNLARNAKVMALGTLVSRVTGFLRTFVFVAALGTTPIADSYNNSNTLPNTVYYLMLGGIFTSVIVPMLVSASKNDPDKGEGYAERIFTLGVIALLIVTIVGTALASPLVSLYSSVNGPAGSEAGAEHHLMVMFAYFFIPQIFFYGMDSLLGAILNVRGRFGANMWTPVINNVIVISITAAFIVAYGTDLSDPRKLPSSAFLLLGVGTTAGILVQSICLFPVLRKAGFSMRLRTDLHRSEISEIGRQAGWLLGYVISQSAGNLIVQRVANVAGKYSTNHGYSAYSYAWSLFQLPYAIVGISVISALLPRMSGHATDRRYSKVREDFSTGVRLASVIVVPAAVFLAVLGAPLCELLFSYGAESAANARFIGETFGVFSLGLVPFMLTQLQLRVFYSFHQNRTPALIGVVMLVVGIVGDLIALNVLPAGQVVIGLAAAYGLVTLVGAAISWPLLLRRVGSLDGWKITRSLVRMFLATLPGLALILVIEAMFGSFLHAGAVYGLLTTVVGGGGALLLYAVCARLLKVEEFSRLTETLAGRLRR
jgi:murein biosynthesis integral membrane protein MurJ